MSTPKKETIVTIPLEDKVTIEVSGYFYRQILSSYFNFSSLFDNAKFESICKALSNNTVHELSDEDQIHAVSVHTYLALLKTLDDAFFAKGSPTKEEVELPPNEDLES